MHQNQPKTDPSASETTVVPPGANPASPILGDFELRREIGRGGMGTVYDAWQVSLQRSVALKVLAPHVASTPKAVARFRREAQAAAKLHHTHIVPIFAQGEAQGSHFYAMELVEGESLHNVIHRLRDAHKPDRSEDQAETVVLPNRSGSGTASTKDVRGKSVGDSWVRDGSRSRAGAFGDAEFFHHAARHLADVADALEYAHANGVIHRDIKPHNLLFGRDERLRISDFGLARLAEQPGVTMTGELLGSPLYMSPEQITGDPNAVDQRTDIYSLGATMYEWLTLSPPYPGETRERVISRILSSEPRPLRSLNASIPADLETICLKAIERHVDRRYRSAGELRDDLRRFLQSRPIRARRQSLPGRLLRVVRRHQLAALLIFAIVLGGGLSWALYEKNRTVEIEKQAAVQAKTEVVEAKEAIEKAEAAQDLMVEYLNLITNPAPAIGQVAGSVARGDVSIPAMGIDALNPRKLATSMLTPSGMARPAVEDFFRSVMSPEWPHGAAAEGNAAAGKIDAAFERWASGEIEPALGLVDEYLNAVPSDPEAVQMRAALYAVLGRFDEMRTEADTLLKLGGSTNGYLWRGLADLLQSNVDGSLSYLTRAMALDQKSIWAKVFRALALLQADRVLDARKLFEDVLDESPKSVVAHLGRARTYTAEGDYAAAMPDVEEVLKVDSKNPHALTIRGECKAAMNDFKGAREDFEEAIKVAGRDPELVVRYVSVMLKERGTTGAPEAPTTDFKSRHGTDADDASSPPVFNWLSPRRRLPEGNRGTALPRESKHLLVHFALPLP